MSQHAIHRRKPALSAHQKQIRFLTGLSMAVCTLMAGLLFWAVNRPSYISH
jgi:hypothetical protein